MSPISSTGHSGISWLKWGAPLVVLVFAAATAGGVALRTHYGNADTAGVTEPATPPATAPAAPGRIEFSADANAHPDHETVRWLLETHFNAINFRRYDTWKTTVVAAKQRELPQNKWFREYASTQDSDIRVHRIESGAKDSLRVLLTFTSVQDPEDSPDKASGCLHWRVIYPLVQDSGGLRLDTSRLPGSFRYTRC